MGLGSSSGNILKPQSLNLHQNAYERQQLVSASLEAVFPESQLIALVREYAQQEFLVVIGGLKTVKSLSGTCPTAEVQCYDPAQDVWFSLPPMNVPRAYHAALAVVSTVVSKQQQTGQPASSKPGKPSNRFLPHLASRPTSTTTTTRIEVFAGSTGNRSGGTETDEICNEYFNVQCNCWTPRPPEDLGHGELGPYNLFGLSRSAVWLRPTEAVPRSRYLLIGHEDKSMLDTNVDVFETESNLWIDHEFFRDRRDMWPSAFPGITFPRKDIWPCYRWMSPLTAVVNDRLYILEANDTMLLPKDPVHLDCLDLQTQQWQQNLPGCPVPHVNGCMTSLDSDIYVISGMTYVLKNEDFDENTLDCHKYELQATPLCHKYSTITNTWSQISSLPNPKENACATAIDGKVFVCGGMSAQDEEPASSSVLRYDPKLDGWTVVAPLPKAVGFAQVCAVIV